METVHLLPSHEYYQLRYLQARAEERAARAEADALKAMRAQADAAALMQAFRAALHQAGAAHGFDPATVYTWRDADCALIETPPPTPDAGDGA